MARSTESSDDLEKTLADLEKTFAEKFEEKGLKEGYREHATEQKWAYMEAKMRKLEMRLMEQNMSPVEIVRMLTISQGMTSTFQLTDTDAAVRLRSIMGSNGQEPEDRTSESSESCPSLVDIPNELCLEDQGSQSEAAPPESQPGN